MSVLRKTFDDNYVIHDSLRFEFENLGVLNFEKKIKVTLTNLIALNSYLELDSKPSIFNDEIYFKNFDIILSDYWKKKFRSFKNLVNFRVFANMMDKDREIELRYEKSTEITLDSVDEFILEYNQNKTKIIKEKRKFYSEKILNLEKLLRDGLFYLDNDLKEIENKMQLKLEEDIAKIKNKNHIDMNIDEEDLDPLKYSSVIKKINSKKKHAEARFKRINKYYRECINSFDNKKDEIDILIEEIKCYQYYDQYLNHVCKNKNSECRHYLNSKRIMQILNMLKSELIDPIEKFINEFLFNNYKLSFDGKELQFEELVKIKKDQSDSELSKMSEETFEQERNYFESEYRNSFLNGE